MTQLDAGDRRILRVLQRDGRITNHDLAAAVAMSQSTSLRRVKRLEAEGVISRYAAVVDQQKVGLPVSVFVQIKVAEHDNALLARFEEAVRQWPEVLECYLMTGPRDYILRVVVSDVGEYEAFIKEKLTRVGGIASIESSFALNQVKYVNELPV